MDQAPTNLHLVPGTTTTATNDEEEWIEEIDESELPPNDWQRRIDEQIQLEHDVWEERMQMHEEANPEGD